MTLVETPNADSIQRLLNIDAIDAERARRKFRHFVPLAWHIVEPARPYMSAWHVDAICDHLQAVSDGQLQNLLITVPPGHAKSLLVAVLWPAWMWLGAPHWRVLCATYASDLTLRDALRSRSIIKSSFYNDTFKPDWVMSADQDAKGYFANTKSGFRYSTSVGGQSTGHRGDCLIADDVISATDAESQAIREAGIFWWDYAFCNRLNDMRKGTRVVIGQRLHDQDLPGHLQSKGTDSEGTGDTIKWEYLKLPSVFDKKRACVTSIWKDPRKEDGELLFPGLFPASIIATEKRRLGSYGFSSQHQQEPAPVGGGRFQRAWFRYLVEGREWYELHEPDGKVKRILKTACWRFQTWDLAVTTKESSCYTAGGTWDVTPDNDLLLIDVDRFREEGPVAKNRIDQSLLRWKPAFQGIERAHYGIEVCQDWARRGLPVRMLDADVDKVTRSLPASIMLENGKVYFKQGAHWLTDFEDELLKFNKGEFDDQVDMFSHAALVINQEAPLRTEDCKPLNGQDIPNNERGSFNRASV